MEKKVNEPDYVIVAEELNELLGLEPLIDVKATEDEIRAKIKEASELLEPEDADELTDFTKNYLEENRIDLPEEEDEDSSIGILRQNIDDELFKRAITASGFKAGDIVTIKGDFNLFSLWNLKGVDLKIAGFEKRELGKQLLYLIVDDPDGNPHSINPKYVNKKI